MEINISLSLRNDEHAAQLLAKLLRDIKAAKPERFDYSASPSDAKAIAGSGSRKAAPPSKNQKANHNAGSPGIRPMGALKRKVFEGLDMNRDKWLPMSGVASAIGEPTKRIKSTVGEAVAKEEVKRKKHNGVFVHQIGEKGLELLKTDRKRTEQAA